MNFGRIIVRVFFFLLLLCPAARADTLSLAEYRQQLQQFSARIDQIKEDPAEAARVQTEIPDHTSVKTGSQEYVVSYDWLKSALQQLDQSNAEARAVSLSRIQQRLQSLDEQAQTYDKQQRDFRDSHGKIEEILARHEFRKSHGPGFIDIWWNKFKRWLSDFFDRHPIYGRKGNDILHIIVYLAVAVAFLLFIIWIKRRLVRPTDQIGREIMPFAPSAKGWKKWLTEAREAAESGAWRDAVHLAYWAGISLLEEQGAWRPDRARTPREYLRMLGSRKPQYPVLSALTRKFEVIWYGHREASAADFQETLGQLEELGCR